MKTWNQQLSNYNTIVSRKPKSVLSLARIHSLPDDVVKYQKFLASNGGRTGGWTDFDHAVFLKIRRHFYPTDAATEKEINDEIERNDNNISDTIFKSFIEEVSSTLLLNSSAIAEQHDQWWRRLKQLEAANRRSVATWRISKMTESRKEENALPQIAQTAPTRPLSTSRISQGEELRRKRLADWRERKIREAEEKLAAEVRLNQLKKKKEELRRSARMDLLKSKMEQFLINKEAEISKRNRSFAEHKAFVQASHKVLEDIGSSSRSRMPTQTYPTSHIPSAKIIQSFRKPRTSSSPAVYETRSIKSAPSQRTELS